MTTENTSASVASIAARGLRDPGSLSHDEIKRVCASALTQRPNRVKQALAAVASVFKGKTPPA
jgi:carnitine O-acetyltransferase